MNFRQDIFFPDLASKCRVRLIYYMVIGWLVNHMFSFHKYAAKRRTLTLWKTKRMRLVLETPEELGILKAASSTT